MIFVCAGAFSARTQSPAPPQQSAGLESDWDIAAVLQAIGAHAAKVLPALDRADPQSWAAKGAPGAYAAQLQSSKQQAQALADGAKALMPPSNSPRWRPNRGPTATACSNTW
jgi:hypothetical protein